MSKKVLSALLSVALVLAVLWTGAVNFSAPAKADAEKVLSEELKGYRRITPADIVDSTGARVMENDNDGDDSLYTLAGNNKKVFYDGNFGGKTYLDANVNFGGGDNRIFWQTDPSLADVRRNTLFLWFKDGNFRVSYYNNAASPSVNGIVEANGSDYGIDNSTTFNIKLLTDVQKASPSAATETVYYQLWINDQYVGEGTATLASHDKCIAEYGTNASKITMRVPTAPEKDIETELAGYRRIDMFDYDKTVTEGVVSFVAADTATSYITDFDKTYLDVDLNYTSSSAQFQYLALEEKEKKYDIASHANRIDVIINNWDEILKIIDEELPGISDLEDLFDRVGLPKTMEEIGLNSQILPMTFKSAKDIRDKYVLPRLCWDLGILDEMF